MDPQCAEIPLAGGIEVMVQIPTPENGEALVTWFRGSLADDISGREGTVTYGNDETIDFTANEAKQVHRP